MIDVLSLTLSLTLSSALDARDEHAHAHHMMQAAQSVVAADVRTVDAEARTALIRHEAMPELSMPAMVMEFQIAQGVNIALFEPGAALMITVIIGANGLEIIDAAPEAGPDGY